MNKKVVIAALVFVLVITLVAASLAGLSNLQQSAPVMVPEARTIVSTVMPFASLYTRTPSLEDYNPEDSRYPHQ